MKKETTKRSRRLRQILAWMLAVALVFSLDISSFSVTARADDDTTCSCTSCSKGEDGTCSTCGCTSCTEEDCICTAVAKVGDTYYWSLQSAVDAVTADNSTVTLLSDVTMEYKDTVDTTAGLRITKSLTLDGQEKYTISTKSDEKSYGIRIVGGSTEADKITVTLQNLTVKTTATLGRCVETRGGYVELIMDNVTLDSTNGGGNTQLFTDGGSHSNKNTVTIKNSTLQANSAGYCIITFNPVNLTIDNSYLTGYATLFFREASSSAGSAGSTVTVKNKSSLISGNSHGGNSSSFSTIVYQDSNIAVTIDDCTLEASTTNVSEQKLVNFSNNSYSPSSNNTLKITNSEITLKGYFAILALNESDTNILTIDENTTINCDAVLSYIDKNVKDTSKATIKQYYGNLAKAVSVAVENAGSDTDNNWVVTLKQACTITAPLEISKSVIVDLAGYTLTNSEKSSVFAIEDDTTLTLTGLQEDYCSAALKAIDDDGDETNDNFYAKDGVITVNQNGNYKLVYTAHTEKEAVQENVVAATCTEAGSYDAVVYCSVCDAEVSRETTTITATGHTYEWVTEDGYLKSICSDCGYENEEVRTALGTSDEVDNLESVTEKVEATVETKDTVSEVSESVSEANKETAETIASSVTSNLETLLTSTDSEEGTQTEAAEAIAEIINTLSEENAANEDYIEQAAEVLAALLAANSVTDAADFTISITTEVYLKSSVEEVEVTSEDASGETKIVLDISLCYDVVATITTTIDDEEVEVSSVLDSGTEVEMEEWSEIEISVSVGNLIDDDATVYIQHDKEYDDGTVSYVYEGTVADGVVTFTNPHGFSVFTITASNPTVAELTSGETTTAYTTLAAALREAVNGDTITLKADCAEKVTISGAMSITLIIGETTFTGSITAANGYELTAKKNADGSITYTVSKVVAQTTTGTKTETPEETVEEPAADSAVVGETVSVGAKTYQITDEGTVTFTGYTGTKTKVVVPATVTIDGTVYKVTAIAAKALKGNTTVTKVVVGKNIETIGKKAFAGCKNLKTIKVKSKNLSKVGKKALKNVKSVTVKVPKKKVAAYTKLFKGKGAVKVTVKK